MMVVPIVSPSPWHLPHSYLLAINFKIKSLLCKWFPLYARGNMSSRTGHEDDTKVIIRKSMESF